MKNIFVVLLFVINILSADSKNIPTYMSDKEYSHYLFLIDTEYDMIGYSSDEEWAGTKVELKENYVIVHGDYFYTNDDYRERYPMDNEIRKQKKKTMRTNLSHNEIFLNGYLYYPKDAEEGYKDLLKAVYEIKNKNRIIDDVEFYNLVYEACLYDETVQKINDLAYLYSKQKNVDYKTLIEVYMNIIDYYPNRTVAYLNLADAYIGINDIEKAKQNYKKYTELMKQENKEDKIPKRVLKYLEK